jgi:1-acyl-sn-glycerol-3-phosphate acyltransferase
MASDAPFLYRVLQRLLLTVFSLLTHLDVEGVDRVPATGPVIVAPNHLHIIDAGIGFAFVRRRATAFAGEKWRGTLAGVLLNLVGNAIYVERGEADRRSLSRALDVLRRGGVLGVAPEGTRSLTGGLQPGKDGAVYLASRTGAPIVPLVAWGQEKALRSLLHFRRAPICVRFGEPIMLPPSAAKARMAELSVYTEQLMLTLARMLPDEYRGVYADRL